MKIHHVGYLVKKLEKAQSTFELLGYELESGPVHDEYRKIDIVFMVKDGYRVELVSPYEADSVVSDMIKKYTNMPYHICYETDDYENEVAKLRSKAFIPIDKPLAAPAINSHEVSFFVNSQIGMIELINLNS